MELTRLKVTKTKQMSEILVQIEKNKNTININITQMKVSKQWVKTST